MTLKFPSLFITLILIAGYLFPTALDDALILENSGDTSGARAIYEVWLDDNSGGPGYVDALVHAASLSDSPNEAISIISAHISKVPLDDSYGLFARIAAMESSLGRLQEAAGHFELASRIGSAVGDIWLLEALALRFNMGEFPEVRMTALQLMDRTESIQVRDESAAIASLCLALDGRKSEALREIDSYIKIRGPLSSPLPWLAMRDIAIAVGDSERVSHSARSLAEDFPQSAVHYLVDARVMEWITPSTYILRDNSKLNEYLQVAAFQSRDRSASLRVRLENDGFTAWIEQSGDSWKVFVNDPDGDVLSRLSDAGYSSLF